MMSEPPLTRLGLSQSFKQGMHRRQTYVNEKGFLRSKYSQKQVLIATTDTERTLASATQFFQGLYPLTPMDLSGTEPVKLKN